METASPNSLPAVLSRKIAELLDGLPATTLLKVAGGTFVAGLLSAAVVDIQFSVDALYRLAHWHDSAPMKATAVFALVFNARRLARLVRAAWTARPRPAVETIEGIPTVELLDHLFTEKSLKVKDATAKFGVPQYRVESLVKHLKRVGALVTGENYASVLNPEFSRQDVAAILAECEKASDLEPLFRRDDLGYTSSPSANAIRSRVEDALTPPPRAFTSRRLTLA